MLITIGNKHHGSTQEKKTLGNCLQNLWQLEIMWGPRYYCTPSNVALPVPRWKYQNTSHHVNFTPKIENKAPFAIWPAMSLAVRVFSLTRKSRHQQLPPKAILTSFAGTPRPVARNWRMPCASPWRPPFKWFPTVFSYVGFHYWACMIKLSRLSQNWILHPPPLLRPLPLPSAK